MGAYRSDTNRVPAKSSLPRLNAVPASRSRGAVLKVRLYLVLGLLVLCALMGVASTVAWIVSRPAPSALTPRDVLPRGVGIAEVVARAWLAGDPIPVPAVPELDVPQGRSGSMPVSTFAWEGYTKEQLPPPNGTTYEVHRFLFTTPYATEDGTATRTLRISVPVATTPSGVLLAGLPVVDTPRFRPGEAKRFDYQDLGSESIPNTAEDEVGVWLSAWAADSRRELKQLSGDTGPGEYVGLGQFSVGNWQIVSAIPFSNDRWLVRVRAELVGPNGYATEMEMDITLAQASTTLPKIIGWGPAGSGIVEPDQVRIITE